MLRGEGRGDGPHHVNLETRAPISYQYIELHWTCSTIKLLSRVLDLGNIRFYNQGFLGAISNKHSSPFTQWSQTMLLSGEHRIRWPSGKSFVETRYSTGNRNIELHKVCFSHSVSNFFGLPNKLTPATPLVSMKWSMKRRSVSVLESHFCTKSCIHTDFPWIVIGYFDINISATWLSILTQMSKAYSYDIRDLLTSFLNKVCKNVESEPRLTE